MPSRRISLRNSEPSVLREGLRQLRESLGVPGEFSPSVLTEATRAAASPRLPETDCTDIDFVTLDPEESTDLDQAFHLSKTRNGFRLQYAIADVAAFVTPGGELDAQANERGETLYAPTRKAPLHPPILSEGAASLLPGQVRPALVWVLEFDSDGQSVSTRVSRAMVRSRAKLSYAGAQAALDAGAGGEQLELLRTLGTLRLQAEAARGGVSLSVPEQEIVAKHDRWDLEFRAPQPVEDWNAQLSLATGMGAAELMLAHGVGIVRTLPPAQEGSLAKLRQIAAALGISWPRKLPYPDFVRELDASVPKQAAMLNACTTLFRGAGYQAFRGSPPEQPLHAAIAAPYAHTTAPLRRLVDRYVGETCVALCAGQDVPAWVDAKLDELPARMADSNRRAKQYERGVVDLVEAMVLAPDMGKSFAGTVLEVDRERSRGVFQIPDPAVEAKVKGKALILGEQVDATLVSADLLTGKVDFQVFD